MSDELQDGDRIVLTPANPRERPSVDDWLAAACPQEMTDDEGNVIDWSCFVGELGLCGCGNPEETLDVLIGILEKAAARKWPLCPDRPEWELILNLMDKAGWIEHGSNISGSWTTEAGDRALKIANGRKKCLAMDCK